MYRLKSPRLNLALSKQDLTHVIMGLDALKRFRINAEPVIKSTASKVSCAIAFVVVAAIGAVIGAALGVVLGAIIGIPGHLPGSSIGSIMGFAIGLAKGWTIGGAVAQV